MVAVRARLLTLISLPQLLQWLNVSYLPEGGAVTVGHRSCIQQE